MSAVTVTTNEPPEQELPWYRYGWPWFLISIPMVSVVLSSAMLYLALNANNSLVVDDYYKEGKAYNLRIERDRLASLLGLKATVSQNSEGLILQLDQLTPADLPASLASLAQMATLSFTDTEAVQIKWVHVTQAQRDGVAQMQHIGGSRYIAQGVSLPQQGKFRLHIEPAGVPGEPHLLSDEAETDWRLVSNLVGFDGMQSVAIDAPAPEKVFTRAMFE